MKKLIYVVLAGLLILPGAVWAKDNYYTNDNGVTLNKEEYDFLTMMYWDGCQNLMTKKDYEDFVKSDIINGEFDTKTINMLMPYGTTVTRIDRSLKISKSCDSFCTVAIVASWNQTPAIKSYDVIGARFESTSLLSIDRTYAVDSSNKYQIFSNYKNFDNGIGNSVNLNGYSSGITVGQTMTVKKGGHVYATYQHAMGPISLNNSMQYTISTDGYGRVFKFSGTAVNLYDKFGYVDIAL